MCRQPRAARLAVSAVIRGTITGGGASGMQRVPHQASTTRPPVSRHRETPGRRLAGHQVLCLHRPLAGGIVDRRVEFMV